MDKPSPLTFATWVQFPYSLLVLVEFVVGSHLAPRVYIWVLRFSSLHKNQKFQISIRPGLQQLNSHLDIVIIIIIIILLLLLLIIIIIIIIIIIKGDYVCYG